MCSFAGFYCAEIHICAWCGAVACLTYPQISKSDCDAVQFDTVAQFAVSDTFRTTTNNIFNRDQIIRSIKPRRLSPAFYGCKAKRVKKEINVLEKEKKCPTTSLVLEEVRKKCEGRIYTLEEFTVKRMNTIWFTNRSENMEDSWILQIIKHFHILSYSLNCAILSSINIELCFFFPVLRPQPIPS